MTVCVIIVKLNESGRTKRKGLGEGVASRSAEEKREEGRHPGIGLRDQRRRREK